ncbi:hypothetical protein NC652_035248 [Populus alba x Populus x berolinensis]|uniref:Uncharacterized protein n=2 Tax=Populus TaxID=3689 RepID=A0A4U5Q8Z9_POPAL|nr:hypothetical protein NC652_035248 [Populus alba x Populus x berolinensis]KAJ6970770.1 hypothetical protein NC653_035142 [Populus alba x Populus x berolinensis]TKS06352.1 hypothetical protein D5086_0000122930 [Populus alba]
MIQTSRLFTANSSNALFKLWIAGCKIMTSHETDGGFMSDSRREFTVVLGVRFDPTDLHRFEVEIQYRFTITCGQSEKTNVKSTTYKTQVQSPTGQGRSTLRYWAFSDSYPFQQ